MLRRLSRVHVASLLGSAALAVSLGLPAQAAPTIVNVGNQTAEPAGQHSYIVGYTPNRATADPIASVDISDDELAKMVFGAGGPLSGGWTSALFTFGQCHSGGFINDIGYVNANVNNPRNNVGVAAAAYWLSCSNSAPADPYTANTFLKPWHQAVDAPHPANDQFKQAFDNAVANDPNAAGNGPQYFGNGNADTAILGNPGDDDFAVLFVGNTDGRPDYLTDITKMHDILVTDYGYTEARIFAYYGDGVRADESNNGSAALPAWIDGSGTKSNVQAGLNSIGGVFTVDDDLFFWVSNHGILPEPGGLTALLVGVLPLMRRRVAR